MKWKDIVKQTGDAGAEYGGFLMPWAAWVKIVAVVEAAKDARDRTPLPPDLLEALAELGVE